MQCYHENCQTDFEDKSSWTCFTNGNDEVSCDDDEDICEEYKTDSGIFRKWCASKRDSVSGKDLAKLEKTGKVYVKSKYGTEHVYCNTPLCNKVLEYPKSCKIDLSRDDTKPPAEKCMQKCSTNFQLNNLFF